MKKRMIAYGAILLVIILVILLITFSGSTTVNNEVDLATIKETFDLDLLVNLGNFDAKTYDESKLLDVAMQLAEKNNLLYEFSDETTFIQYVSREDLHSIIKDFTGIVLESPIEIEDFYYLYDSENDYYFYRPASPSYFKVKEITSTKVNGEDYSIKCFIAEDIADESAEAEDVTLSITTMPNNNWIKYRVEKIEITK